MLASQVGKTDRVLLLMQLKADVNFRDEQDVRKLIYMLHIVFSVAHGIGACFRTIEHRFTGQHGMPM